MTTLTIIHSNKSSTTAKSILSTLGQVGSTGIGTTDALTNLVLKKILKNKRVRNSDIVIRYGNSTSMTPRCTLEINTPQAVHNASNKLVMLQTLIANDIKVPLNTTNFNAESLDSLRNEEGFFFVRGSNNSVRYDNTTRYGDQYVTKEIKNKREYRVHVFDGKIMGVYRKQPNNETDKLLKADNCHFHRCVMDNTKFGQEGIDLSIKAVQAVGLMFGGVDIVYDKTTKKYTILEVNSSPSLNSANIKRFIDLVFTKYNEVRNVQTT